MQEIWSEYSDKPTIELLVQEDVKELFNTKNYDFEQGKYILTNYNYIAEKFMKKYGIKVGNQYFIEKDRFLNIIRQTGELSLEENK